MKQPESFGREKSACKYCKKIFAIASGQRHSKHFPQARQLEAFVVLAVFLK